MQRFHAAASALSEPWAGFVMPVRRAPGRRARRLRRRGRGLERHRDRPFRSGQRGEPPGARALLARPQGLGLKQVQAVLASQDATAADPATLAGKSVAMQGLGALEFVLFGTGADVLAATGDGFRCRYGAAIAANLDAIAAALQDEWQAPDGFAARWTAPGPENPLYRDRQEALTELSKCSSTAGARPRPAAGRLPRRESGGRSAQAGAVLALGADRRRAGRQYGRPPGALRRLRLADELSADDALDRRLDRFRVRQRRRRRQGRQRADRRGARRSGGARSSPISASSRRAFRSSSAAGCRPSSA